MINQDVYSAERDYALWIEHIEELSEARDMLDEEEKVYPKGYCDEDRPCLRCSNCLCTEY